MVPPEILRLSFPDLGALEREIANNLRYGRVFVGEILDAPLLTEGVLVIVHPVHGRELRLAAQVVMVNNEGPMRGTGIALRSFGPNEVQLVQAFAREQAGAAPEPRPRALTPEPRPRALTPEPRPRALTPEPRPRALTPEPRPRALTPEPRPRALTPEPRPRALTPEPRPRALTPEPRPRRTPVPMPVTLMERPRKGTPDPRSEAVTVRPSTGPIQIGTVPPSAPENDWSDLHSSGLAREAPRSEQPAPRAEEPMLVDKRGVPPSSSAAGEAWSDFADPDAEARAAAFAANGGEVASKPDHALEPEPDHALEAETRAVAADPSGHLAAESSGIEVPAEAGVNLPVADDDWSDVTAAIAEPGPRATVAATTSSAESESEAEVSPEALEDESYAADGEAAFDDDPSFDPNAPVAPTELQSENRQHRLRALNAVEQLKVARRGELSDRVVVERLYGKQVWEALLQNPRITLPEVARIARKGTVPRPLIESILENGMWTKAPNVRRALLSNPKLTGESVMKLLRMLPKHELKVMEKATAFPMTVRDAARKLLREGV